MLIIYIYNSVGLHFILSLLKVCIDVAETTDIIFHALMFSLF